MFLNLVEIRKPETDSNLVAEDVARQLERRVSFRRAMKRAMQTTMRMGAQGVLEILRSRPPWRRGDRARNGIVKAAFRCTRCAPTSTTAPSASTYGIIGIKCWIFKGEIMEHDPMAVDRKQEAAGEGARAATASVKISA